MSDYTQIEKLTDYTTSFIPCSHKKGWYFIVKFWIFKREFFWCNKCHKAIPVKFLQKNKKSKK